MEGGKRDNPEKNQGLKTKNKLNPHVTPGPGIKPGAKRWETSALATAPSLLPDSPGMRSAHEEGCQSDLFAFILIFSVGSVV